MLCATATAECFFAPKKILETSIPKDSTVCILFVVFSERRRRNCIYISNFFELFIFLTGCVFAILPKIIKAK